MRVLQVVHNFAAEHRGGTERYTSSLCRALAGRGHAVEVFTTTVGDGFALRRTEVDGLPVAVLQQPRAATFRERRRIQAEVRTRFLGHALEGRAEVVHVQHLIDISPSVLSVPSEIGVPGLVSLHDFWYRCPRTTLIRKDGSVCRTGPQLGMACVRHCRPATTRADHADTPGGKGPVRPSDLAFVARDALVRRALDDVDRFVAGSRFTRDTYVRLGIKAGRIDVIPWGIDDPATPPAPRRPAERPIRLAFLGHLSPAKGADLAIEAFGRIDPSRAVLTMHGPIEGPQGPRFRALLDSTPHVLWSGPYGRSGLHEIMGAADAVLMPSRALENYPLVVQEAFQHGVPMVVRRAGSLPEVVRDGIDGVVFGSTADDLRRTVEGLAQDPGALDRLAAGIHAVKRMADHAGEIEALYERLRGVRAAS